MNKKSLITRLKNAYGVMKGSKYFVRSYNLVWEKKYSDAEVVFEQGEKKVPYLLFEYKILKGRIKFNLNKDDECVDIFHEAWKDIDRANKLSKEEELYLKKYIHHFTKNIKTDNATKLFSSVSYSEIQLGNVKKSLRRDYPMRQHPEWVEPH